MYKVKLTFPYPEWDLLRQTPNSAGVWGDVKFYVNEEIEECDYWFVFNHLLKETEVVRCPRENVVLLTGEPYVIQRYNQQFLNQFARVITCQREIKHANVTYFHQGHPWFVGARYVNGRYLSFSKTYDELIQLNSIAKTKKISVIASNKQFTEGHKRRFEYVMRLKDYYSDVLDVFGRGVKDFEDKWDVLADYKFSIAIENFEQNDWMTEKLYDCFLAHTFPLYHGCPNVDKYFDPLSFKRINIDNWDNSRKVIDHVLNENRYYENQVPALIAAKHRYLNSYNIFPLIVFHMDLSRKTFGKIHDVKLANNYLRPPSSLNKISQKLRYVYRKITK